MTDDKDLSQDRGSDAEIVVCPVCAQRNRVAPVTIQQGRNPVCRRCKSPLMRAMPVELPAEPITRERMDLLWMNPGGLRILKISLGSGKGDLHVIPDGRGGLRELLVTVEDVEWAERVNTIAERASSASRVGDFVQAIKHYREALASAPGCDLYLMSIGSCYAQLGDLHNAKLYLERAAKISPDNRRIQDNLAPLSEMLSAKSETTDVQFVRLYSEERDTPEGKAVFTYEVYRANTNQEARRFLEGCTLNTPLFYIVVETPEGNWSKDVGGTYQESG